jgi:hypothetical protein
MFTSMNTPAFTSSPDVTLLHLFERRTLQRPNYRDGFLGLRETLISDKFQFYVILQQVISGPEEKLKTLFILQPI